MDVGHGAGISKKVAKLKPLGVIKGIVFELGSQLMDRK